MFEKLTHFFVPNTKESAQAYRNKIGIFQGWVSVWVNGLLFGLKLVIGIMVGAVSVIADAVHTLSDVVSSSIVIWGFKQADKPADVEHPYGHGRAEYIATLIIAVLLVVAGIEFIEASIQRIRNPEPVSPQWWMVIALILTIVLKEITARYAEFLSGKIASGTLHADAWHHRSDAISSFLVVGALIAGNYGYPTVDGWAGLGVALFLMYTGFVIAREAIDDLIGKPPTAEEVEDIRRIVMAVEGVLGAHDITIHSYGQDKFVSVHIEINADESPERAHDLAEEAESKLETILGVEPTIHVDPVKPGSPMVQKVNTYLEDNWAHDSRIGNFHDIRIVETDKHNVILFGLTPKEGMTLEQKVECYNELKKDLKNQFTGFDINIKVSPLYRY